MTDWTSRPADLDEYGRWTWDLFGLEYESLRPQFERSAESMQRQFTDSPLWSGIQGRLTALADAYYVRTGYLLGLSEQPPIRRKDWDTFWLKTFRRNVIENKRWPQPPRSGWLLPPKWFVQIGDVVRTRFVVRYLDAVIATAAEIERAARDAGYGAQTTLQATPEG